MIKIIEHGTIKKKQCENCGCLFSYEKEDIEHSMNLSLEGFACGCGYDYIICPQCKEEIRLRGIKMIKIIEH